MRFIFATHNQNKVHEVNAILSDMGIHISSLSEIEMHEEIVENGKDLKENAWIKSDYIYQKLGGNVIADDTGLEVDALAGAPGVYSARYAGPQRSSQDNMDLLLRNLNNSADRSAQFRTVLAAWIDDKRYTFEGIVRGRIDHQQKGNGGFGYDPIFIPEGYDLSFGELPLSTKNKISHRGRAFQALKEYLLDYQSL